MDLMVLVRKVHPQRIPLATKANRATVWGIVNCSSVHEDCHTTELQPAVLGPRLSKIGSSQRIVNTKVDEPHSRGSKVIKNGMPHTGKTERDEDRKKVVSKDSQAVDYHENLNGPSFDEHLPCRRKMFE